MTILRIIATILLLGPVFGFSGTVYAKVGAFNELSESGAQPKPGVLSRHIQTALITTLFGWLFFLTGVALHAIIAKGTGVYSMTIWVFILTMSIFNCVMDFPIGTVLGLVLIILLFTLPTFRKMRAGVNDVRSAAVV